MARSLYAVPLCHPCSLATPPYLRIRVGLVAYACALLFSAYAFALPSVAYAFALLCGGIRIRVALWHTHSRCFVAYAFASPSSRIRIRVAFLAFAFARPFSILSGRIHFARIRVCAYSISIWATFPLCYLIRRLPSIMCSCPFSSFCHSVACFDLG